MSSGGGSKSSWSGATGNPHVRTIAHHLSMNPDSMNSEGRKRMDYALRLMGIDGRDALNADNVQKADDILRNMRKYSVDNNLELSTGNSIAVYKQEDVKKVFDSYQESLGPEHEDRVDPIDVPDNVTAGVDNTGQPIDFPSGNTASRRTSIDQLTVDDSASKFDRMNLADSKTTSLEGRRFGVAQQEGDADEKQVDQIAQAIETKFIDELYGTTGGDYFQQDWHGEGRGAIWGGDSDTAGVNALYGLDLRRTMVDADGKDITYDPNAATNSSQNQAYYEHITRGQVDWASYQQDPAYARAFRELELDLGDLTVSNLTAGQRVNLIRKADAHISEQAADRKSKGSSWRDEDGVRDGELTDDHEKAYPSSKIQTLSHTIEGFTEPRDHLYIDGERQVTMMERLRIPSGDTREINVAPPGSRPIMKTVKSAYMTITNRNSKGEEVNLDDMTSGSGGTFTIGGDFAEGTTMRKHSQTLTIAKAVDGPNFDFLDTPPTLGGAVTWTTNAAGNKIPSLTNPTTRRPKLVIDPIPVPSESTTKKTTAAKAPPQIGGTGVALPPPPQVGGTGVALPPGIKQELNIT